jgi:hypothetical protein
MAKVELDFEDYLYDIKKTLRHRDLRFQFDPLSGRMWTLDDSVAQIFLAKTLHISHKFHPVHKIGDNGLEYIGYVEFEQFHKPSDWNKKVVEENLKDYDEVVLIYDPFKGDRFRAIEV